MTVETTLEPRLAETEVVQCGQVNNPMPVGDKLIGLQQDCLHIRYSSTGVKSGVKAVKGRVINFSVVGGIAVLEAF